MKQQVGAVARASALRGAYVGASVFLMTAALILVKTGRDALYFQKDGLSDLHEGLPGNRRLVAAHSTGDVGIDARHRSSQGPGRRPLDHGGHPRHCVLQNPRFLNGPSSAFRLRPAFQDGTTT